MKTHVKHVTINFAWHIKERNFVYIHEYLLVVLKITFWEEMER